MASPGPAYRWGRSTSWTQQAEEKRDGGERALLSVAGECGAAGPGNVALLEILGGLAPPGRGDNCADGRWPAGGRRGRPRFRERQLWRRRFVAVAGEMDAEPGLPDVPPPTVVAGHPGRKHRRADRSSGTWGAGRVVGSPAPRPPDQARGGRRARGRSRAPRGGAVVHAPAVRRS